MIIFNGKRPHDSTKATANTLIVHEVVPKAGENIENPMSDIVVVRSVESDDDDDDDDYEGTET